MGTKAVLCRDHVESGQGERSTGQNMNGSKGRNQTSADKDSETLDSSFPSLSGQTDRQRTALFYKIRTEYGQRSESRKENSDRFRRALFQSNLVPKSTVNGSGKNERFWLKWTVSEVR